MPPIAREAFFDVVVLCVCMHTPSSGSSGGICSFRVSRFSAEHLGLASRFDFSRRNVSICARIGFAFDVNITPMHLDSVGPPPSSAHGSFPSRRARPIPHNYSRVIRDRLRLGGICLMFENNILLIFKAISCLKSAVPSIIYV